ncbi:MAG: hypothetical protein JWN04_1447, partial [Myxococcaceae bacterium]|nr:hypothetical protein [Myxococcaceae bacterium]
MAKYLDHTPLERQVRIMRREGLDIDSRTLREQCERLARALELTGTAIRQYVVQACVMHCDETPWYMLKKGRQKQWMWSISRHDAALYRIDPSRGHQDIVELLDGFEGLVVVNGYQAYGTAARASAVVLRSLSSHSPCPSGDDRPSTTLTLVEGEGPDRVNVLGWTRL